jgi:hypothetical protein
MWECRTNWAQPAGHIENIKDRQTSAPLGRYLNNDSIALSFRFSSQFKIIFLKCSKDVFCEPKKMAENKIHSIHVTAQIMTETLI